MPEYRLEDETRSNRHQCVGHLPLRGGSPRLRPWLLLRQLRGGRLSLPCGRRRRDPSVFRACAPDRDGGCRSDYKQTTSRHGSQAERPALSGGVVVGVEEGPRGRLRGGNSSAQVRRGGLMGLMRGDPHGHGSRQQLPRAPSQLGINKHELRADGLPLEESSPQRGIEAIVEISPERLGRC